MKTISPFRQQALPSLTTIKGGKYNVSAKIRVRPLAGVVEEISNRDLFQFLWIKRGSVTLYSAKNSISAGEGKICCLGAGHGLELKPDGHLQGYLLEVPREFMHTYEQEQCADMPVQKAANIFIPELIEITPAMNIAEEILNRMMNFPDTQSWHDAEILKGYLTIFLLYLNKNKSIGQPASTCSRDAEIVDRFLNLIRTQFIKKKMVSDYAGDLFVTAAYLNRIVKKVSGHTASYHIQQYTILEAKRLCRTTRQSMKEVAYSLGFNDIAHFSKFFKNYTGMNFTSFKKEVKQTSL